jgi:hypothetical protein
MQPAEQRTANSRRRAAARLLALFLVLAAIWSAYHLFWRQHVKRFAVVRPGVLYRVAQPSELGIRYLVERHGVKTVLNLRLEDEHLPRGVLALGTSGGDIESHFVADLGVHSVQWPMGREACWPWVTPWQFEEFFRLFDDAANWPVAVHCVSGRHRTGTIVALFRLEYDRWPIDRVLAEMYSFSFGPPVPLQEFNLRTYTPRPQPSEAEWQFLRAAWSAHLDDPQPDDYAEFVRRLRSATDQAAVKRELAEQLAKSGAFALPLAVRLIDTAEDPACQTSIAAAARILASGLASSQGNDGSERHSPEDLVERATFADRMSAAALVADFGSPEEQEKLLSLLRLGINEREPTPEFCALVGGIANRYTGNRIPFLAVLLDDRRTVPDTGNVGLRFCDLAIAHLSAILDERLINVGAYPTAADWEQARERTKAWLNDHPQIARMSRLVEPTGHNVLR